MLELLAFTTLSGLAAGGLASLAAVYTRHAGWALARRPPLTCPTCRGFWAAALVIVVTAVYVEIETIATAVLLLALWPAVGAVGGLVTGQLVPPDLELPPAPPSGQTCAPPAER